MTLKKLRETYQILYQTKLPSFCGQDSLDDWLEELIEVDAHLAMLACLAISGVKILVNDIPRIILLKNSLFQIHRIYPKYGKIIYQFNNHLQTLIQLENHLRSLTRIREKYLENIFIEDQNTLS